MNRILKNMIAVTACFALTAIGFSAVEAFTVLRELRATAVTANNTVRAVADHVTSKTLPAVDATIARADGVLAGSSAIERNLNQRISDTSQNMNALLVQAGLAADQVRIASIQQREYWDRISGDTDKTLQSLNQGADGITKNMEALHALLADPQFKDAIAQADGILADSHAMTTDAKKVVHKYTQPPSTKDKILANVKDMGGVTYLLLKISELLP
jgi:hypothetical protein